MQVLIFCESGLKTSIHTPKLGSLQKRGFGSAYVYLHTKWYPDPCSCLAIIDVGRKSGRLLCPFLWGAGPHQTQCRRGRPPYQVDTTDMDRPESPARELTVIAASMYGFDNFRKIKSPVTLTLDRFKVISACTIPVRLPACPTI